MVRKITKLRELFKITFVVSLLLQMYFTVRIVAYVTQKMIHDYLNKV